MAFDLIPTIVSNEKQQNLLDSDQPSHRRRLDPVRACKPLLNTGSFALFEFRKPFASLLTFAAFTRFLHIAPKELPARELKLLKQPTSWNLHLCLGRHCSSPISTATNDFAAEG